MQTPMTRKRMLILIAGVAVLAAASAWRLRQSGSPTGFTTAPPVTPDAASALERLSEGGGVYSFSGETMGTTYSVKFVPPDPEVAPLLPTAVESALRAVNASMSTYDPQSELSLLNRMAPDTAIPVSEELFFVLELARQTTTTTGGAFDVTVAPLVRAFGFGAGAAEQGPSESELEEIRAVIGMQHLELDPARSTIRKKKAGVEIDLSAIAKGYGVDRIAAELKRFGVAHYMVEVGGEIRVRGSKKEGRPWRLAIEHPDPEARRVYAILELDPEGSALATSGDYRNFREVDGQWLSHTVDPRTARPVPRRTASVSVLRPTAAEADALATGLGVLEPQEAMALAESHGWAVLILVRRGKEELTRLASPRFAQLQVEYVEAP